MEEVHLILGVWVNPGGRASGFISGGSAIIPSVKHLYVHVPFCQRRCSYCDFSIAVRKRIPAREYVDAVLGELALVLESTPGWVNPGAMPRGWSEVGQPWG